MFGTTVALESMAPRRKISRGAKRSHLPSPQATPHRNEKFPTDDTTYWMEGQVVSAVTSSLDTIRSATIERVPNKSAREQLLRDELIKVGDYVEKHLSHSTLVFLQLPKKTRQVYW